MSISFTCHTFNRVNKYTINSETWLEQWNYPDRVKSSVLSLDLKTSSDTADFVWSDSEFHTLGAENWKAESADLMEHNGNCSINIELERNRRAGACFTKQLAK